MTGHFTSWRVLFAAIALVLAGTTSCSSTDEPDDASTTSTSETSADATSTSSAEVEADESAEADETVVEAPQVFELMVTEPTEPGPRPFLAWDSVEGASTYDLIVLDAAGTPYWAWSGEATGVHLGGVENPEAVGAWVFEPLTWIVTARDSDGQPLAMSGTAQLEP